MSAQALDFPCNPLRLIQLSSSTSDYYSDSTFEVDIGVENGPRNVLLRRLSSIAAHLANSLALDDETVLALHGKLDGLENELGLPVVDAQRSLYTSPILEPVQEYLEEDGHAQDRVSNSESLEEGRVNTAYVDCMGLVMGISQSRTESVEHSGDDEDNKEIQQGPGQVERDPRDEDADFVQFETFAPVEAPGISSTEQKKQLQSSLLEESQQVLLRVSKVAAELQRRCEETKHIHDLSIFRAEKAAQRIINLESNITALDSEVAANASALTYLKLQLKVLEVQASPYIPLDDRDGLRAGIQRWKLDWADADMRFKARRRISERNDGL